METIMLLFLFLFGLVIGSFLNVVILRYNTGKTIQGRSACFSCGTTLQWHHLIPLVSFIALRGKCAYCRSRISMQYPLVELATALLFVTAWIVLPAHYSLLTTHYALGLVLALIAICFSIIIFVYDMRHKIIPDGIVFAFMGLGFISLLLRHSTPFDVGGAVVDIVSAFLIFLFFFSLWYFSKGTWMGFGDGKLALAISLFLPWAQNLSAIIISFWIGAVFGLLLIGYEKVKKSGGHHSMSSELPFAPFMIISFFLVLFANINLIASLVL